MLRLQGDQTADVLGRKHLQGLRLCEARRDLVEHQVGRALLHPTFSPHLEHQHAHQAVCGRRNGAWLGRRLEGDGRCECDRRGHRGYLRGRRG
ncbi:MAG: hypothetical protein A2138_12215 [Deltaproteobacteria bacterium RBG_16_71_12]|nr:MAG: hypothetical protein A2138_12215 [Deltaproteobacteria bacterium RBG_16_71_12]